MNPNGDLEYVRELLSNPTVLAAECGGPSACIDVPYRPPPGCEGRCADLRRLVRDLEGQLHKIRLAGKS